MIALSTAAFKAILVATVSPEPPPEPAGISTAVISAPLLFWKDRRTDVSSSLTSAFTLNSVEASTSLKRAVTTLFSTGLVESADKVSSTSRISTFTFTLPAASGVCFSPFTVTLFTVPLPPNSSQLASWSQASRAVPVNWYVSHLPSDVSKVMTRPRPRHFSGTAAMAEARV